MRVAAASSPHSPPPSLRARASILIALALASAAGFLFRAFLAALETLLALFLEADMRLFAACCLFRALVRWCHTERFRWHICRHPRRHKRRNRAWHYRRNRAWQTRGICRRLVRRSERRSKGGRGSRSRRHIRIGVRNDVHPSHQIRCRHHLPPVPRRISSLEDCRSRILSFHLIKGHAPHSHVDPKVIPDEPANGRIIRPPRGFVRIKGVIRVPVGIENPRENGVVIRGCQWRSSTVVRLVKVKLPNRPK
jgi:hypothetical protein